MENTTEARKNHGLINRKGVRRFLLDYAARHRAHRYQRVSPEVYAQLEATLREQCRRIVTSQPSVGKTIK